MSVIEVRNDVPMPAQFIVRQIKPRKWQALSELNVGESMVFTCAKATCGVHVHEEKLRCGYAKTFLLRSIIGDDGRPAVRCWRSK